MNYRLPELEIPADNPFRNDVLNRKPLVEFLAGLIGRLSGPFVLALDSPWGTGKTTLVRMMKAQLEQEQFQCVYFNAWQVDYVTDPLVALVSAISGRGGVVRGRVDRIGGRVCVSHEPLVVLRA